VTQTRDTERNSSAPGEGNRGFFGRIVLFVRQVIAELRKVVRPTRDELIAYTSVVLVFVAAIMVYVSLIDFGMGRLVLWVFGGSSG
jgi:preprotein translocase subunit SecE